jgi:hypothetical protein
MQNAKATPQKSPQIKGECACVRTARMIHCFRDFKWKRVLHGDFTRTHIHGDDRLFLRGTLTHRHTHKSKPLRRICTIHHRVCSEQVLKTTRWWRWVSGAPFGGTPPGKAMSPSPGERRTLHITQASTTMHMLHAQANTQGKRKESTMDRMEHRTAVHATRDDPSAAQANDMYSALVSMVCVHLWVRASHNLMVLSAEVDARRSVYGGSKGV